MPILFACPYCNEVTLVDDEYAGQSGPCVGCGKQVQIPVHSNAHTAARTVALAVRSRAPWLVAVLAAGGLAGASGFVAVLYLAVLPAFGIASASWHTRTCAANLRRIAAALRQYEDEHGTLPPAYIPDASGRPMHSWRVLLLPQLGERSLYDSYNFNEPWDGPTNIQLAGHMPAVYHCPADPNAVLLNESNYVVLTGPRTLFPHDKCVSRLTVPDDLATTIMVVETLATGATWIEPRDLKAERMEFSINATASPELGAFHGLGANVLLADDSVVFLREWTPAEVLQQMSTADGGEPVLPSDLP